MEDKEFLKQTITVSRDEFSDVMAYEIANLIVSLHTKLAKTGQYDPELIHMIEQAFLMFSADIMTQLFDTGKLEKLEIGEGEE